MANGHFPISDADALMKFSQKVRGFFFFCTTNVNGAQLKRKRAQLSRFAAVSKCTRKRSEITSKI